MRLRLAPSRVCIPPLADLPVVEPLPAINAAYRPRRRLAGADCGRCGLALDQHARCSACGALAGPAHPIAPHLVAGQCPGCLRR